MNGIRLTVTHPDFVENEDGQRAAFGSGFQSVWSAVKDAQKLTLEPVVYEDEAAKAVQIFFSYGENGVGVRSAEEAIASTIATVSLHVAMWNHEQAGDVLPAYGFSIERDVAFPEVS